MRNARTILILIVAIALGNLACKSNSAASMSKEDKYKIYYAASMSGDKELQKSAIKKLGIGTGDSTIPDHDFFTAFIDWTGSDEGKKFTSTIHSPEEARNYVNKQLPN